ncbi:MAG: hypothetical protein ACT4PW_14700 [Acidimicrobiia bacterium]
MDRRGRLLRAASAALCVLMAACGADDDGPSDAAGSQPASAATASSSAPGTVPVPELVASGATTPFGPVPGRLVPIEVGDDGSCKATAMMTFDAQEPNFALCQVFDGEGGRFAVVTVSRATDDHDVGLACAVEDGFVVGATAIGEGTPVSTTLDLAGLGTFAILSIHDDFVTDATAAVGVVVAQPAGEQCPVVHGLGPVNPGAGQVRATASAIEVARPTGILCTTFDAGGFTSEPVAPPASRCP